MTNNNDFNAALERLRSGVYIVTSMYRNELGGCTCVWVTRASFEPPLIAVCLAPIRHTLHIIEQGKRFCINIVGESGLSVARHFGSISGTTKKKFIEVASHRGKSGSPILDLAAAYLDCHLVSITPAGDHRLVLGEIIDAAVQSTELPLIYDQMAFFPEGEEPQRTEQANHHSH
jgi:flavin reductase (DIM6/NTAB) family NADH-FMN oxidoreductase RutF